MADEPLGDAGRHATEQLEAQLEDALQRAKAQLSHLRENLGLVATFLTRAER